jgi:pyruvate formate-lyase activating enzyme-like uncharacterized protein
MPDNNSDTNNNGDIPGKPTEESASMLELEIRKLKEANRALISEFTDGASNDEEAVNDVDSTQSVLRELSTASLDAIKTLRHLTKHSESDAVKASCAKYILDWRLGLKVPTTPAGDGDLATLVAALRKGKVDDGE